MKYAFLTLLALVSALALSACETMSAGECAGADWRGLGFNDAANNGADRFGDRAESCADKGFGADGAAYASGFSAGMRQFCQPPNGFAFARRGGAFNGSCPAELQYDFLAAYNDGRRVHDAEYELGDARSGIGTIQSRRREIDEDLRDRERELSDAATDEERNRVRGEIDQLRRERRDLNDDLRTAEERAYFAQRHIDDLRQEIGDRWAPW
ncbi:MAG: DUF2799 domain-containing protein [Terricaulis sp.]